MKAKPSIPDIAAAWEVSGDRARESFWLYRQQLRAYTAATETPAQNKARTATHRKKHLPPKTCPKSGNEWSGANEIVVNRAALVYYDGDGKFIQPAYMFEATIVEGETKYQYLGAIAALKQSPERIGPGELPPAARSMLKEPKPPESE